MLGVYRVASGPSGVFNPPFRPVGTRMCTLLLERKGAPVLCTVCAVTPLEMMRHHATHLSRPGRLPPPDYHNERSALLLYESKAPSKVAAVVRSLYSGNPEDL